MWIKRKVTLRRLRRRVFSKWKEIPYKVSQWTVEMLEEQGEMEGQDNLEESSDDEDDDVDQEESNSPSSLVV